MGLTVYEWTSVVKLYSLRRFGITVLEYVAITLLFPFRVKNVMSLLNCGVTSNARFLFFVLQYVFTCYKCLEDLHFFLKLPWFKVSKTGMKFPIVHLSLLPSLIKFWRQSGLGPFARTRIVVPPSLYVHIYSPTHTFFSLWPNVNPPQVY